MIMMLQSLLLMAALQPSPPPTPSAYQDETEAPKEEEKLAEWPKPANAKQLGKDVTRLRKASTEEMGIQAKAGLIAEGAAAAPELLKAFGKEKDEDAQDRIAEVLANITSSAHTRLLAKELKHKSVRVRIWVLRRLSLFPDHGLGKDAVAHLAALKKKGDKADPDELKAASLCTLSTGEISGLDVVFEMARDSWGRYAEEIRVAAREVRGELATSVLGHHLTKGKRKERVAALRLLASCGDSVTALPLITPLLDENDNSIRIGAINALRGIVDNAPPLDKLPVFEAIELARKWKERVG